MPVVMRILNQRKGLIMSMISEQVKELRKAAKWFEGACFPETVKLVNEAADAIESLSAKLADAKRSAEDCGSLVDGRKVIEEMEKEF